MANAVRRGSPSAKKTQGAMGKIVAMSLVAVAALLAHGAWYDDPEVKASAVVYAATVNTDPHYINKSANDELLMVDLNSWETPGAKTVLFSIPDLRSASGVVCGRGKPVVDAFGNAWKGGAISSDLKLMIPGNGTASATSLIETDKITWTKGSGLYPLTFPDSRKLDGMDFGTGSAYLYSNADSGNVLYRWTLPAKPYSADANTLTLSASKTTSATRIRNISVYNVNGRELVYYGEGSGTSGRVWVMDVTDAEAGNWTETEIVVADALGEFKDITNVKLSNEDSATPILYVLSDAGKLAVCRLDKTGKVLGDVVKTFQKADINAYANVYDQNSPGGKFRNFEVTRDGSCAFFVSKTAAGETRVNVVSSRHSEAAVPVGYRRTDYLESTGTQYVRLGRKLTANTRLVYDIELTDKADGSGVDESGLGGISTGSTVFIYAFKKSEGIVKVFMGSSWSDTVSGTLPVEWGRHVLDLKSGSQVLDGVQFGTLTLPASPSAQEIPLFCTHEDAVYKYKHKMRLYGFKLYEGDSLCHDLVPYENGTSGILYDKVTGETFKNAGSGEFLFPRRDLVKQVEWIATDGSQYVNTGVGINMNMRVVSTLGAKPATLSGTGTASGWSGGVCAAGSTTLMGWTFAVNSGDVTIKTAVGNDWTTNVKVMPRTDTPHSVYISNGLQLIDGDAVGKTSISANPMTSVPFYLFALDQYEGPGAFKPLYNQRVRFYGCQIYRGDMLVRDFVPAVSNGVAGLCDRVHGNRFYLPSAGNPFKAPKGMLVIVR